MEHRGPLQCSQQPLPIPKKTSQTNWSLAPQGLCFTELDALLNNKEQKWHTEPRTSTANSDNELTALINSEYIYLKLDA